MELRGKDSKKGNGSPINAALAVLDDGLATRIKPHYEALAARSATDKLFIGATLSMMMPLAQIPRATGPYSAADHSVTVDLYYLENRIEPELPNDIRSDIIIGNLDRLHDLFEETADENSDFIKDLAIEQVGDGGFSEAELELIEINIRRSVIEDFASRLKSTTRHYSRLIPDRDGTIEYIANSTIRGIDKMTRGRRTKRGQEDYIQHGGQLVGSTQTLNMESTTEDNYHVVTAKHGDRLHASRTLMPSIEQVPWFLEEYVESFTLEALIKTTNQIRYAESLDARTASDVRASYKRKITDDLRKLEQNKYSALPSISRFKQLAKTLVIINASRRMSSRWTNTGREDHPSPWLYETLKRQEELSLEGALHSSYREELLQELDMSVGYQTQEKVQRELDELFEDPANLRFTPRTQDNTLPYHLRVYSTCSGRLVDLVTGKKDRVISNYGDHKKSAKTHQFYRDVCTLHRMFRHLSENPSFYYEGDLDVYDPQ